MTTQGQETCREWLEPRYWGVHDLMIRLRGRCTCQDRGATVHYLYTAKEDAGRELVPVSV